MRLEPGSKFAGYVIREELGRGAMGVVYVAWDPNLDRDVALKVVSEHLAGDESFRERFAREARSAAKVQHPGVVTVYQSGEANGIPFIAMQLVRGRDFARVLERDGRMDPSRALAILGPIADGLDAAHTAGIVHRDVKPENILVPDDNSPPVLVDFGIGRIAHGTRATRTGTWVGTADYVSPEQIRGQDVDGRSDQYSLACVLFEAVSGSPPFTSDDPVQAIYAQAHTEPPGLPPDLSHEKALAGALARALSKVSSERFPTCSEFVRAAEGYSESSTNPAELRKALSLHDGPPRRTGPTGTVVGRGLPATSERDHLPEKTGETTRRRRRPILVSASLTVTALVSVLAVLAILARNDDANQESGRAAEVQASANSDTIDPICANAAKRIEEASQILKTVEGRPAAPVSPPPPAWSSAATATREARVALEDCLAMRPDAFGGPEALMTLQEAETALETKISSRGPLANTEPEIAACIEGLKEDLNAPLVAGLEQPDFTNTELREICDSHTYLIEYPAESANAAVSAGRALTSLIVMDDFLY